MCLIHQFRRYNHRVSLNLKYQRSPIVLTSNLNIPNFALSKTFDSFDPFAPDRRAFKTVLRIAVMSTVSKPQFDFPDLPCPPEAFLDHVEKNPGVSVHKLLQPFNAWENVLRSVYAQDPDNPIVENGLVNLIDVFANGNSQKTHIRGRNFDLESTQEKEKYIMPLNEEQRKKNGQPAVVASIQEFQKNFNIFTENAFTNFDWTNVVAAGSAVLTCLTPVPEKYSASTKGIREYYHEIVAPASDIDLFIYGIDDDNKAIDRMIAIEKGITDNFLGESTCLRTKNCITIVSHYPNRHIQIVLRLYKSISQILTGFDVNCACTAYNGTTVVANPRALTALMTQCNTMDLTRRSPSYENRLSKYSHRGFEIYCEFLDRSKIDPTIFERSFAKTVGLARLLVLERLPKPKDREDYVDKRKRERGRTISYRRNSKRYSKDLKSHEADEVPDWQFEDDVSEYNTFTIPYGKRYDAKRITKLFYTTDLLLNAEWNEKNKPPFREVHLHRHPVFIGTVAEIVQDCCGYCPVPQTEEDKAVYEHESKHYIHGPVQFMKDNPGRQAIGSFHPLGASDYTDMAYITDSEFLFKAITNNNVADVKSWCSREDIDINRRDHCGRTPLHVAAMCADSVEIIQALIDRGARLIARLQDGRTALHIAAGRGKLELVEALLRKSEINEQEKLEQEDRERLLKQSHRGSKNDKDADSNDDASEGSDIEICDAYESGSDCEKTSTAHSFVKIKKQNQKPEQSDGNVPEENLDDPDIFDINAPDWDFKMTPLHHAILAGCGEPEKVIELLVSSFGADVMLPVNVGEDKGAILNIALPFLQPANSPNSSLSILRTLLKLGASCAQANSRDMASGLHSLVGLKRMAGKCEPEVIDAVKTVFDVDGPAAKGVINCLAGKELSSQYPFTCGRHIETPLTTALALGYEHLALMLLENGANSTITLNDFTRALNSARSHDSTKIKKWFECYTVQPLEVAIRAELALVKQLLGAGANPSTILAETYRKKEGYHRWNDSICYRTVLDLVRDNIKEIEAYIEAEEATVADASMELIDFDLQQYPENSYRRWRAELLLNAENKKIKCSMENERKKAGLLVSSLAERQTRIAEAQRILNLLRDAQKHLLDKGAKSYFELLPEDIDREKTTQRKVEVGTTDQVKGEWQPNFDISAPNMSEDMKELYLDLFDASWSGDITTIKKLTLFDTKPSNRAQKPVLVTAHDDMGFRPFLLAIMKGHLVAAKLIWTIGQSQYSPKENTMKAHYNVATSSSYGSDLPIVQQSVQTAFIIDNIANEQVHKVTSNISPMEILKSSSVTCTDSHERDIYEDINLKSRGKVRAWSALKWSTHRNKQDFIEALIKMANLIEDDAAVTLIGPRSAYDLVFHDPFGVALRLGRIAALETFMKEVGCGINYEKLSENEVDQGFIKPQYYLGLTINGKKKKDWAKSANPNANLEMKTESLLHIAAFFGNIESVHWLLSDRPLHCLQYFTQNHPNSKRAQTLARLSDLSQTVKEAIGIESSIVPHLIIKGWNGERSQELLSFWLSKFPEQLEAKCVKGRTPLLLAADIGNIGAMQFLISAGANVLATNNDGKNILHFAFEHGNAVTIISSLGLSAEDLKVLLRQRAMYDGVLYTVWYRPVLSNGSNRVYLPILEYLMSISDGHGLDVLNGDGNLPIHKAVFSGLWRVAQLIIEKRPDMLHRENANGRTPLDISKDYILLNIAQNTMIPIVDYWSEPTNKWKVNTKVLQVHSANLNIPDGYTPEKADHPKTHEFLLAAEKSSNGRRIRATLFDANELAHRLANKRTLYTIPAPERDLVDKWPNTSGFLLLKQNNPQWLD